MILSVCASRNLKRELIRGYGVGAKPVLRGRRFTPGLFWGGQSFGIHSWTGNESISRNPSRVPIFDGLATHSAFKAADFARHHHYVRV